MIWCGWICFSLFHFLIPIFHLVPRGGVVREVIFTEKGPKAIGPYSQAIKANGFIFVSGQTAFDPTTGDALTGDAAQQAECIMENLKAIVQAAGSSLDRAVRLGVFLQDMNDFAAVNEVYARYFPKDPPARTTVEVSRLPRDFRVEIDLIALA
jgi:2-iminobutanoate/2-iminopropanoate deaminase